MNQNTQNENSMNSEKQPGFINIDKAKRRMLSNPKNSQPSIEKTYEGGGADFSKHNRQ